MAPTTRRRTREMRKLTAQPPNDIMIELNKKHDKKCMLCGHKEINEKLYGPLYQLKDVVVHYYCILLSSSVQSGDGDKGIRGFLYHDIKNTIQQGSRITCVYCKKLGATIRCCGRKCQKTFHLPCGLKNGSMHQYYEKFKSYCKQHRMIQSVDIKDLQSSTSVECAICKDNLKPIPSPSSLWAPCCKNNSWFHRDCIQGLALSSGYFFKCPICHDVGIFKGRMLHLGIYIPSRDASWETVPNAFEELLERHCMCNAVTCLCPHPEGRNYHKESGSWNIILCQTCGSSGTHRQCSLLIYNEIWFCSTCSVVANNTIDLTMDDDSDDGGDDNNEESPERKRRRLEIQNVSSNSALTLRHVASSSSQNRNTYCSNASHVSTNVETRESTTLNTNQNDNTINNGHQIMLVNARQLGDIIIISDSDVFNSNVEVISSTELLRAVITRRMPVTLTQNRLPIISRNSTSNTTISTYQHRHDVVILLRNIEPLTNNTIDLTMYDDSDDGGDDNNEGNIGRIIEDINGQNYDESNSGD